MTEEWRDIPGYEGRYQVSSLGRVKTLARITTYKDGRNKEIKEKIHSAKPSGTGYPIVALTNDNGAKAVAVHILVARAFLGEKPFEGAEVRHLDHTRTNNAASNLAWGSRSENQRDRWRKARGSPDYSHWSAKLTPRCKVAIEVLLERTPLPQKEIAELFGVSEASISRIARNVQSDAAA